MYYDVVFKVKYPGREPYDMSVYVDDVATKQAAIAIAKKQMKHNFGDAEICLYISCTVVHKHS